MKKMKPLLLFIFIAACIFCSCQNPDDPPGATPTPESTSTITPEITPDPVPPPPVVTGVEASCLRFTDKILVRWEYAEDAESYKISRYLHKSPEDPVEFTSITNEYEDKSAVMNTPYFYRVASVTGSETSDLSANYVKGIYSTIIDNFEDNDDISEAEEVSGQDPGQPNAIIYSFNGGEAQDIDWYKYLHTGDDDVLINIKVILPAESPFIGELTLEIENDGDPISLDEEENTEPCLVTEDLYFVIYFTSANPDIDEAGTYTVYYELL